MYDIIVATEVKSMIVLTEKDYLEAKLNSLIADYDKDTLINLYQPIVGYEAVAIYLT